MPLHISHELAVEIKHVGVLALMGTRQNFEDFKKGETVVFFILQSPPNTPLSAYFHPQQMTTTFEKGGLLQSIMGEQKQDWVNDPADKVMLLFFERRVKGVLRDPNKFLHATAGKLLKELQKVEDEELWWQEFDAQWDWGNAHYGTKAPMPDFSQPRHVD